MDEANNVARMTTISSLSDEQLEGFARFILKGCFFQALFYDDSHKDLYEVVKSPEQISSLMFPMVVQAIKTGSRAERTYLSNSDKDYIYEIGPLVVNSKPYTGSPVDSSDVSIYLHSTENRGFYTIRDKNERYIYPTVMHSKLAPIITGVKAIAMKEKSSASSPVSVSNFSEHSADAVIAFKCMEWPQDIWEEFSVRNPKHIKNMFELKGKYFIYFHYG